MNWDALREFRGVKRFAVESWVWLVGLFQVAVPVVAFVARW